MIEIRTQRGSSMSLPARNEMGDEGKTGQELCNVHDKAPSQVSAHVGAVEHFSGEAEGGANDQRPCRDVRYMPVGRRVH